MNRRRLRDAAGALARRAAWALLLANAGFGLAETPSEPRALPPASARSLPRWRGFNLLEKFDRDRQNGPFLEEDFKWIAEFGFNFVRLPMDYRVWILEDDWRRLNEDALAQIDQAVEWSGRYGIHVCLNFHRAPGYSVAPPAEPFSLWTDEEALAACAFHWAAFARRYRGIPNERLSFNLINEPPSLVDGPTYARVVRRLLAAIRAEDPDRLVICDGLAYGVFPCPELEPLGVAQSGRGYIPFGISHYRAEWADAAHSRTPPAWPDLRVNAFLYGPVKAEFQSPLRLVGHFGAPSRVRLRALQVSGRVRLRVWADDRIIGEKLFEPGAGEGEWTRVVFRPEWNIYQNEYDRSYAFELDRPAREIRAELAEGDWLLLGEIGFQDAGAATERVLPIRNQAWGARQSEIRYDADDVEHPFRTEKPFDREWLKTEYVAPWRALQERGVGVMIGEWGAYRHTAHAVTLRWMRDNLENWREAGIGWALWNFRGPFGVLDSDRADVEYEDFRGHRLDRKMLELLQSY